MDQFISAVAQKMQMKPGKSWLLYNAPQNYMATIEPLPKDTKIGFDPLGDFDGIQLFVVNNDDLINSFTIVEPLLKPDTVFWLCYPKKSSGIKSDLEMMGSWEILSNHGLRVVTSVSIDNTWTALRFKPLELTKLLETRNAEIKQNEYAAYIDVDAKQIKLPAIMLAVLEKSAVAMAFYQGLSYSNKKEYVIWILSAKQEKTQNERLDKLIEKLLSAKRNPAEK
jgi:hypothetical protein